MKIDPYRIAPPCPAVISAVCHLSSITRLAGGRHEARATVPLPVVRDGCEGPEELLWEKNCARLRTANGRSSARQNKLERFARGPPCKDLSFIPETLPTNLAPVFLLGIILPGGSRSRKDAHHVSGPLFAEVHRQCPFFFIWLAAVRGAGK